MTPELEALEVERKAVSRLKQANKDLQAEVDRLKADIEARKNWKNSTLIAIADALGTTQHSVNHYVECIKDMGKEIVSISGAKSRLEHEVEDLEDACKEWQALMFRMKTAIDDPKLNAMDATDTICKRLNEYGALKADARILQKVAKTLDCADTEGSIMKRLQHFERIAKAVGFEGVSHGERIAEEVESIVGQLAGSEAVIDSLSQRDKLLIDRVNKLESLVQYLVRVL